MTQLSLWNDVRLPDEYYDHYIKTGHCLNCRKKLRHELHALNHYAKYHTKKGRSLRKQKFYVWINDSWKEVQLLAFLTAQRNCVPTAFTKR